MKHPDPRIEALLGRLASPKLATIDLSLDRMKTLLAALGNPEERLPPVVHVAGTNGKGSLLAYLAAILHEAGIAAHRYISPHLVRFNERILLSGKEIDDAALLALLERVERQTERHPVTFFEATTAAAFLAFSETPADIVLLETGLGGRLDATNLVRRPLLTAITPVSMDHMDYLGDTLKSIAAEKAGIIKPGVPLVTGPQAPAAMQVIEAAAHALNAPLFRHSSEWNVTPAASAFHYRSASMNAVFPLPGLAGDHQRFNAGTAIACVEHLKDFAITHDHIARGLLHAAWPARLQHLKTGRLAALLPPGAELWLDGGHNPAAGEVLALWAQAQAKPVHLLCGMLKTKDAVEFLKPLASQIKSFIAVAIDDEPLSQTPEAMAGAAKTAGIQNATVSLAKNIKDSIEAIVQNEQNGYIILICGSLYLAGNILWQNNPDA